MNGIMFDTIIYWLNYIREFFEEDLGTPDIGKKYEVWGYDTYASESYFCGSYDTLKEAKRVMKILERRAWWTQRCKSLRDTFGIKEREDLE
jgi:hypothetical protein